MNEQGAYVGQTGIGWAIKQMHNGKKVSRKGWNGPGQFLAMQKPDAGSLMTVQGARVPWIASQTDLLAIDWDIA